MTVELSVALTFNLRFPVEDPCVLVGELDGVRIVSSKTQELLQEVPLVCQDIFKIASMAPGALLLEAHREYEVRTHLSDSATRSLAVSEHPVASVCVEVESEGRRVSEGDQGAKRAGRGCGTVRGGGGTRIRPPHPEIPAQGESDGPPDWFLCQRAVLYCLDLSTRRRRLESAF